MHAIGRALAQAEGLKPKHAVKQVDRLLSNTSVDVWFVFGLWIPYVIGARKEIVVALDWTEFDGDDQATLALHLCHAAWTRNSADVAHSSQIGDGETAKRA